MLYAAFAKLLALVLLGLDSVRLGYSRSPILKSALRTSHRLRTPPKKVRFLSPCPSVRWTTGIADPSQWVRAKGAVARPSLATDTQPDFTFTDFRDPWEPHNATGSSLSTSLALGVRAIIDAMQRTLAIAPLGHLAIL
ncbi:hypothetical protein PsYK624_133400 [Phanerochaete sordida]|uniref:Uncharacterized protein n=1 Tax=Phanerochaete sordida TaxID=48140 RepID=A0A9P3GPI4_9APHY|nr:hypothetical protein PsYK624_133400 [Phanerochaete sordida]